MMIRSDKELAVSRRKLREAEEAASQSEGTARKTLERFADDLRAQVDEFEVVRSGQLARFLVHGIDQLGDALIKARIAKGWTQQQLAEALDVSAQQVQKNEAGGYERAAATRLAEVAEVLGYELRGELAPSGIDDGKQDVSNSALPVGEMKVRTWGGGAVLSDPAHGCVLRVLASDNVVSDFYQTFLQGGSIAQWTEAPAHEQVECD